MKLFKQIAKVQEAQHRMHAARRAATTPAAALLARAHAYPLGTVGVAAGAGFVLGSLNVHPMRVPGVAPLLNGSLAEAVAWGTKMVAELGVADVLQRAAGGETAEADGGEPS